MIYLSSFFKDFFKICHAFRQIRLNFLWSLRCVWLRTPSIDAAGEGGGVCSYVEFAALKC